MLRTFIQVLVLGSTLLSAYFLIRGTLALSKKDLAELSVTKLGYNLDIAKSLCHQRIDTVVGFSLLLASFLFQLCNMLWEMRACDFAVSWKGLILGLVVCLVLIFVCNRISDALYQNTYSKVHTIIKEMLDHARIKH